jgi:rhodanese-related sulfurtransferase
MNRTLIRTITCRELHDLAQRQPVELIDVRTPEEFQAAHVTGARNVPLDSQQLFDILYQPVGTGDPTLYFICEVGGRSGRACAAFMSAGHPDVVNVEGGMQVWLEAGLPVERGI